MSDNNVLGESAVSADQKVTVWMCSRHIPSELMRRASVLVVEGMVVKCRYLSDEALGHGWPDVREELLAAGYELEEREAGASGLQFDSVMNEAALRTARERFQRVAEELVALERELGVREGEGKWKPGHTLSPSLRGEYTTTPDEDRVITFLQHARDWATRSANEASAKGKFGTAAEEQHKAIILQGAIDAIQAGYHNEAHPHRVIDPQVMAIRHFHGL